MTGSSRRGLVAFASAAVLFVPPVFAQSLEARGKTQEAADSVKLATLDLAVPDSPAFTVLGLSPSNVARPTSPKDLATSLLNGVDRNGHLQTGAAIELVPRMLIGGSSLTWSDYRNNYGDRLAARTQVSYGATKGATADDPSVRMALGVHVAPWDAGDPRLDTALQACFDRAGAVIKGVTPPLTSPEEREKELARRESAAKPIVDKCRAEARKRNWAASSWSLGIAPTWTSTTGAGSDLAYSGVGLWTSLALGIGDNAPKSQLILHARYRTREQVADSAHKGQFIEQDSGFFGGRYRFGNPDFAGAVEAGWIRKSPAGSAPVNTYHVSAGFEHRLGDNTWIDVMVGSDGGSDLLQHPWSILSSFKYGFSKTAQLADVYQP